MGIQVEFNPNLCLRRFGTKEREPAECLPEKLEVGSVCPFLKRAPLRNFWLEGEVPLYLTEGKGPIGKPLASIVILESTHFLGLEGDREPLTRGCYSVMEVYDSDDKTIHFEGFKKLK